MILRSINSIHILVSICFVRISLSHYYQLTLNRFHCLLTCDECDRRNEFRKNEKYDGKILPYERFRCLPELELEFVLTLSMLGERSRVAFNGIRSGSFRERTTFRNRNIRRTFFILFQCFLDVNNFLAFLFQKIWCVLCTRTEFFKLVDDFR